MEATHITIVLSQLNVKILIYSRNINWVLEIVEIFFHGNSKEGADGMGM